MLYRRMWEGLTFLLRLPESSLTTLSEQTHTILYSVLPMEQSLPQQRILYARRKTFWFLCSASCRWIYRGLGRRDPSLSNQKRCVFYIKPQHMETVYAVYLKSKQIIPFISYFCTRQVYSAFRVIYVLRLRLMQCLNGLF